MQRSFLALVAIGFSTSAFGETLVSGAIYFDSENTLQEVVKLSELRDNNALGRLLAAHHVSPRLPENTDIQLYLVGPSPESPAEFRFINNPTTYWTLTKFIEGIHPTPTTTIPIAVPNPTPNPPPPTPTPLPTPSPTPTPTSTPKSVTAMREREDISPEAENPPPPLRKHRRIKEHSFSHPPSNDDEVPNSEKVWHSVNGHWKWYLKRPNSNIPTASPVPRALPVQPPS